MDTFKIKIAQLSDIHLTSHKNLLETMVPRINQDALDLVVVTGDLVHDNKEESYNKAVSELNKIRHKVVVLPGDYDNGALWEKYFGTSYKSLVIKDYCLDFLDTSYLKHRFASGWGETLSDESPTQYEWLKNSLSTNTNYHIIFSHHPHSHIPKSKGDEFLTDNVRAIYSGHVHEPVRQFFKYDKPKKAFANGFMCTPLKFHGNACYLNILIRDDDELVQVPIATQLKKTAW